MRELGFLSYRKFIYLGEKKTYKSFPEKMVILNTGNSWEKGKTETENATLQPCLDNASVSEEAGDASYSHTNTSKSSTAGPFFIWLLEELEEAAVSSGSFLTYPRVI